MNGTRRIQSHTPSRVQSRNPNRNPRANQGLLEIPLGKEMRAAAQGPEPTSMVREPTICAWRQGLTAEAHRIWT